jgi:hypothetical protein
MPPLPGAPADPEGEPPVHRRVPDRGDQQRQHVRGLRGCDLAQQQVQHRVRDRAQHANHTEPQHPLEQPDRPGRQRRPGQRRTDLGQRDPPASQVATDPDDPPQVVQRGAHQRHPRVRVVHPVHRHLVDPQPGPLGQHQQLGVEEPGGVPYQRQQLCGHIRTDRLETALRVGEPGPQHAVQQRVVPARDQLAPRPADHPGRPGQPGPDREVTVSRDQRRHQRQQRVQVGGQIDVHVREHVGVAR